MLDTCHGVTLDADIRLPDYISCEPTYGVRRFNGVIVAVGL